MIDDRKLRRAKARLTTLQADLNRYRGSFYLAIGHGDPGWVRRCHKAIRDQQEKIRKLSEVHGLERPHAGPEAETIRALDQAAQDRLQVMLFELERQRTELERAQAEGDPLRCDRAGTAVRGLEATIRVLCSRHGIDLPAEVPVSA